MFLPQNMFRNMFQHMMWDMFRIWNMQRNMLWHMGMGHDWQFSVAGSTATMWAVFHASAGRGLIYSNDDASKSSRGRCEAILRRSG